MRRALVLVLSAVALLLGVSVLAMRWLQLRDAEREPLVLGAVPAFRLTDQSGASFSSRSLEGHVWIAAFVFTRCRGQCPVLLSALRRARAEKGSETVRLVAFTVDPEHDTPEALRDFARTIDAQEPEWIFLTGERDTIYELARRGFLLGVEAAGGDSLEPILHSPRLVLVDAGARVRGYYDGTDPQAVDRLRRDAARLLEDARRG